MRQAAAADLEGEIRAPAVAPWRQIWRAKSWNIPAVIFGVQHGSCLARQPPTALIAIIVVLAISFGLIVPKMAIDYLGDRTTQL